MASLDGWLEVGRGRVGPEHIDYNGHMNVPTATMTNMNGICPGHKGCPRVQDGYLRVGTVPHLPHDCPKQSDHLGQSADGLLWWA